MRGQMNQARIEGKVRSGDLESEELEEMKGESEVELLFPSVREASDEGRVEEAGGAVNVPPPPSFSAPIFRKVLAD